VKISNFSLEVISFESVKKFDIQWATFQSPSGEFTVGPGHSPIVSIISSDSSVRFKPKNGDVDNFAVMNGVLVVSQSGLAQILMM
jgi:F0F1-type ATP synthase epsilon subunit